MFWLFVYQFWVYRNTSVALQWNTYVQCGNHICSVIYLKFVYRVHCHMVDCSDFIYSTYMCMCLSCKSIKYIVYIPNMVGIFVFINIFGNNMRSMYCSWLCFRTYVQKHWCVYAHIICQLFEWHMQCGSHICSALCAYMELKLYIDL